MSNLTSNKQKITITLETEVYLRVKTSNINASNVVNEFFKGFFEIQDQSADEKTIEELEKESEEHMRKATILKAKAQTLKNQYQEEVKKRMDQQIHYTKGKKDAGVMDFDE